MPHRTRRILLYGFGPYKQFRENITARIIKAMPRQPGLKKLVFPVRFDRGQFVGALKRHRPDVVIGLGQSTRRRIEIEARAANRRRSNKRHSARPIFKSRARWLPTTLALRLAGQTHRSKNAGEYVCNYSMYVLLDHIRRSGLTVDFGFIHIPYDYDLPKSRRCVIAAVRGPKTRAARRPLKNTSRTLRRSQGEQRGVTR